MDAQQRIRLAVGGVLLTLLLAAVFTLGSLDVPLEPKNWSEVLALYALSSFVTAALLVFGLILIRSVLRLWAERSKQQLGARFKTKMVVGAMGISLLPILFMFFVSYSLLNRTLARWFPRPLEIATEESRRLVAEFGKLEAPKLRDLAEKASGIFAETPSDEDALNKAVQAGADAAWVLDPNDTTIRGGILCPGRERGRQAAICVQREQGRWRGTLPGGMEVWQAGGNDYLAVRSPEDVGHGRRVPAVLVGERIPAEIMTRYDEFERQLKEYGLQKQGYRTFKAQLLLAFFLFTVLLLFAVMWVALFLAKQVTVPIQALAEGTREVSAGNFDYQVPEQAQDELGVLVRSFNAMTTQLRDSRRQIDEFTRSLQQAVQELERRRQIMETILENIPTGVLSLDASGAVLRANSAMSKIIGEPARSAAALEQMLGAEAARLVQNLMRRALRMGIVTREIEMIVQGRVLHAAVTVSSLGPRRANTGYVVVIDDLTEVLRAQKSAAWQEVAKRIAHEIKNPLTPIQLSSQRLNRYLERREGPGDAAASRDPELAQLVQECSRLIEREVTTLASLVNEFSQFVRFPTARLAPTDANQVVREALEVFAGRLEGINVETHLESKLPAIRADGSLLRSVVVNLIDNAAEALEDAQVKEIRVSTRTLADDDLVEVCIEDTGHGISPQDKDKLFLPNFSTKDRGTGLGLAIAARIIAEHGGTIRVEDNRPSGTRFFLELPVSEPVLAHPAGPA